MRTSIQRAWPSKVEKKTVPEPIIHVEPIKEPIIETVQPTTQPMVVSVDSKDLAAQISPLMSDRFFFLVAILCGTSVFCTLLCLCMAMQMSSALRRIAQKL